MINLKGQYALVTGASSGIGNAVAHLLAQHGVNLMLVGRDLKKLKSITEHLKNFNVTIEYHKVDFAEQNEIESISDYISESFNQLNILIHNAGILQRNPVDRKSVV